MIQLLPHEQYEHGLSNFVKLTGKVCKVMGTQEMVLHLDSFGSVTQAATGYVGTCNGEEVSCPLEGGGTHVCSTSICRSSSMNT